MAKQKFQEGDRVKVVSKNARFKEFNGRMGIIDSFYRFTDSEGKHIVYVVALDGCHGKLTHFSAVDLELVAKFNPEMPKSDTKNTPKSTHKLTTITDDQLNRMHTELGELGDRMKKLDDFVNCYRFNLVDEQSKSEMMIQLNAMKIYHQVLVSRYNRLLTSKTSVALYMD